MNALTAAHIAGQERLRQIASAGVQRIWGVLPGYDDANVDQWLSQALPLVLAAQRQSVAITQAFVARSIGRQPVGVDPEPLIGAGPRADAELEQVYRRPFITLWTALKADTPWERAIAQGLARASGTAATDVQLSMRATLRDVGAAEDLVLGYQRVPDGGACTFCRLVAGQRYHSDQLMPIHAHCGCGVEIISGEERPDFTGRLDRDLTVERDGITAEVREHGELGPLLVNGDHHFDVI